jgi:hypothetical protein
LSTGPVYLFSDEIVYRLEVESRVRVTQALRSSG